MGGANAHIVLEEYACTEPFSARPDAGPQCVAVSAQNEERLRAALSGLRDYLAETPATIQDVAYTLQVGRQQLEQRWAAVADSIPDLLARIDRSLAGVADPRVFTGNARSGRPPARPQPDADLSTIARAWVLGAPVDWEAMPRHAAAYRTALPHYPFERKRYWLTDGMAELQAPSGPVATYYNATVEADPSVFEETYLSLAPLPEPTADFSWSRAVFEPERYPELTGRLREKQRELRRVFFRNVDFAKARSVLDFGCGLGTDLIVLAKRHPHLRCTGYSISSGHAGIAAARVRAEGLQERVSIAERDSSADPFPGSFDAIFGIEVAHHIQNKEGLFANIAGHLAPAGRLLLIDCVSRTAGVEAAHTGSFTWNTRDYAGLMARHRLRIAGCVDASSEIANCLRDPHLDATLAAARARGVAGESFALVDSVHRSWDHFGKALESGLIRYVLLELEPEAVLPTAELSAHNRRALEQPGPYAQALGSLERPAAAASAAAPEVTAAIRRRLIEILQTGESELASGRSFADLGLDSLSGLKFVDALNRDLGLSLGAEVIYDHATLPALARHLASLMPAAAPAAETPAIETAAPERVSDDDIAVVGISVRFPGASNLGQFWDNLACGRDSVREVPRERWDVSRHYSPDATRLDTTYGKWAGLLDDYDRFDPLFFNISPREAEYMDPQQRLFLEESWKALEDAGYAEAALSGMRCGVYAGVLGNEYQDLVRQNRPPDAYAMLGNSASILAARLSYILNLKGPSLSIDTACSSSLVAVDLACKALGRGEIELALAGGVALYLSERPFIQMSRAGLLSKEGRCRTFDRGADGIAPGEGVGVVVLKRLRDALADRDHIYGVIRASATNQDGRTNGITAPSAASQTSLIRAACEQAGIDPGTITCVEAHGTGTPLGDPIEIAALTAAYASGTARQYCAIGSVKTNVGHTSAAAGIAGLAKLLASMQHRQIPPSLHFDAENERIRFAETPFYVNTELRDWTAAPGAPRRAALSAFGFSGTNAHVIVDEPPPAVRPARPGWCIAAISAKTEDALQRKLAGLANDLDRPGASFALPDICFTLNAGRQHFGVRRAFVARDTADLAAQLRAAAAAPPPQAPGTMVLEGVAGILCEELKREAARETEAYRQKLSSLGALYCAGCEIDWTGLYRSDTLWRVPLPAYPFARERCWCDAPVPSGRPMLFQAEWVPSPIAGNGASGAVLCWRDPNRLPDVADLERRGEFPTAIAYAAALAADGSAGLDAAFRAGVESLFLLVRSLSEPRRGRAVRIAFVYRRDDSVAGACHGAVAAMAKSLRHADAGIELIAVGVAAGTDESTAIELARNELCRPRVDSEVRYAGDARLVRTNRELPATAGEIDLPRRGVCVITGGLGGVPHLFARHLAERFQARLPLLGRSPLDTARGERIRALEALGAEVRYFQADVAEATSLAAALGEARAAFGHIDAAIHAAGFIGSQPWMRKSIDEFRSVFAVKARGAVLLDELTREDDLRFFVMFSSLSSSVGDFGEGDYSAANRFLSEFAEVREAWRLAGRRRGRTLSIEWPMWEEGGIRFPEDAKAQFLKTTGMMPLTGAAGVPVLGEALSGRADAVLVAQGDAARLRVYLDCERAGAETVSAPPSDLESALRGLMSEVLRIPAAQISPSISFNEYGFDSITLKEFAGLIARRLGLAVNPVQFFASGTLRELSAELAARQATVPAPAVPATPGHATEPIAVIGMSGVFPGSPDLDRFWDNLAEGRDLVTAAPEGREHSGAAGYIDDVYGFDADFFQISAQEAGLMDPQQRILLETAWKAIEQAGYRPLGLSGTRTGIFVGAQASDFSSLAAASRQPHAVPGASDAMLANRISYLLNWRGPSEVLDTACSSSLVAVHRAVQALRAGEADLAIAAGVSLLLSRQTSEAVAGMGVLSPAGRCKVFDRSADGYVRGEGAGVVVLKPLSKALADRDRIWGLILESGVNHGGRTSSLTAPSPIAQAELLAGVWQRAGVAPETISYIEAHGTGTELGDPIEIQGMQKALGVSSLGHCGTGSVKSNIGHLEPASGIANLIKVLLALDRAMLPPSLHCRDLNPHIDLGAGPVSIVTSATAWSGPVPRRAGVSSFGFGGVNAHVLVEEPPAPSQADAEAAGPYVFPISARTPSALRRSGALLRDYLRSAPGISPADVAYTLQTARDAFEHRMAIVASSLAELASALESGTSCFHGAASGPIPMRELLNPSASPLDARAHDAGSLARRWAEGAAVDWSTLYAGPRHRLALPAYPFEHKEFRPAGSAAHPLAGRLVPTRKGTECRTLLRPELPWVRDHRVQGHGVLAGAAVVEMARAAAEALDPSLRVCTLRDVTWSSPIVIDDGPREIAILLREGADGVLQFEVPNHAQGSIAAGAEQAPALDIASLQTGRTIEAADVYQRFATSGLHYGPAFRRLRRIWNAGSGALGEITPAGEPNPRLRIDPGVLDAAMQTAAVLLADGTDRHLVPFSFDELALSGDVAPARYAWAVRTGERIDISIADERGHVMACLKGLYARPWKEPEETLLSYFRPSWEEKPATPVPVPGSALIFRTVADLGLSADLRATHGGDATEVYLGAAWRKLGPRAIEIDHRAPADYRRILETVPAAAIYFLGGLQPPTDDDLDLRALDAAQQFGVLSLFRLAQALWSTTHSVARIRVVTNQVHKVLPADQVRPEAGALSGFCRALAQEFSGLSVSAIDVDAAGEDTARLLAGEGPGEIAYRNSRRYVHALDEIAAPPAAPSPLREGGVYWIVGGAGGLGSLFAKHLASRYSARLVLSGRSPASAKTDALLTEIAALGGEAVYRQADASDLDAMRSIARETDAKWGAIHGAICSAVTLRNGSIPTLAESDFTGVFAPKVQGAIILEQALRGTAIDFVTLFSSAISLTQAAGQSNYAAASSFQDAAAQWLAGRLRCPVKTVNWGYWGMHGIVATPELRERMRGLGVGSIGGGEGVAAWERILASDLPQAAVARLLHRRDTEPRRASARMPEPAPLRAADAGLPQTTRLYVKRVFSEIIRRDPAEIGDQQDHETLGIDSLVMMQLLRRLEQDLGPLPKTLFFENTNVSAVAAALIARSGARLAVLLGTEDRPEALQTPAASTMAPAEAVGDIAIVGVSGRYPMSPTLDEFWENLRAGRNCISEVPPSRWDHRHYFDPKAEGRGKTYSKWGGFLEDIDRFDNLFFGISAREAAAMDPQERLFLETAWATLEDAGHTRQSLAAMREVGVFVGVMHGNYQLFSASGFETGDAAHANSPYWSIANRVSYVFDLHGPSLAVDTACSSSLAAIHLACESIRRGECCAALAGGVSLIVHPKQFIVLSAMKMLSHGDRDRSFGADADGFVLGEGVGAVLLRPLADALHDGDRIYGIVKSSAMNAGGKTPGYTVPNPHAQTDLVRRALEAGAVDPATITYVEAHGTGTALGDPIEVAALNAALGGGQPGRCALGSVKSNIGHLEAAAGIAALTKVLLQLEHETIAPTLHCAEPNTAIEFEASPLDLCREARPWPRSETPRRAGISSFGAGGTNVHLIVEEAPRVETATPSAESAIVPLSARSQERLRESVRRMADFLASHPEIRLQDVAHTLQTGREAMAERVAFLAADLTDLVAQMRDYAAGHAGRGIPSNLDYRPHGRRISLPGYPFERVRHWVKPAAAGHAAIHPLVDRLEPSLDGVRAVKDLTGAEFYLQDHQVAGQPVLPGVAHLEAARAAAAAAGVGPVRGFQGVQWLRPFVASSESSFAVQVTRAGDGDLEYRLGGSEPCGRGRILIGSTATERPGFDVPGIRARCDRSLSAEAIYAAGASPTVRYGPRFQVLRSIVFRPGEALSELRLDAETAAELTSIELHPAILDGALQSAMGILLAGGRTETLLPFAIERVTLFGRLDGARYVYIRGGSDAAPGTASFDAWILDAEGIALARLQDVVMRAVRATAAPLSETEALERLEHVARLDLLRVFREAGLFVRPGAASRRAEIAGALRVAPRYERLLDAFLTMLEHMGAITAAGDEFRATPRIEALAREIAEREAAGQTLLRAHAAFAPHLTLLERCMSRYPEILRGEVAATEAFFPGGNMETVEAIYRGSAVAEHFHKQVAAGVRAAAEAAIARGGMARILEIGAGTGGTTVRVLEELAALAQAVEFHYTDISAGFTHFGKINFGRKYPFVKFAVLDIEKTVEPQGFVPGTMDVVYASNVLHATRNIRETVAHAKDLLAENGALLLNEMTAARDFATLTFGLLDGWFRYDDGHLRLPHSPLLDVEGWTNVFREAGLEPAAAHGQPGESDPARFQQAVLVSRKPAPLAAAASLRASGDGLSSIEDAVVNAVAEVFEMSPEAVRAAAGLIPGQAGVSRMLSFTELGADSILSAELVEKINRSLQIELKTTAIFNYPGVRELARHIHEEYSASQPAAAAAAAAATPAETPRTTNGHSGAFEIEDILRRLESGELSYDAAMRKFDGDRIQ
jgi:polyketide synthase PksN